MPSKNWPQTAFRRYFHNITDCGQILQQYRHHVITCKLDIITFRVSRRRRGMYCGHARLCVCLSVCLRVCLSVRGRLPTLLHGPGCNLGEW